MAFQMYEERNALRPIINFIASIVVVISLAWFIVYCFGHSTENVGQSMEPTLEPQQKVLINTFTYCFNPPERFDIIAFDKSGRDSLDLLHEENSLNIKRIIGLPGETVRITDGNIYINGVLLDNPEGLGIVSLAGIAEDNIVLKEDEYFVLGDNRQASEDSRFTSIGNIKKNEIIGKCWLRTSPISRL